MSSIARPHRVPLRSDLCARDERLVSLGLLAGHLAHDFNNLLAPILGYSTLIKEEFPADSSGQQFTISLENSARRAEKILDQTLLATRPQRRFSPQDIVFDELIADEVNKWTSSLPTTSGVSIQSNLAPCALVGDAEQFRHVLRNLLNNARFGCSTGGRIKVETAVIQLSPSECANLGLPEDDIIRLRITDDGFGMTAESVVRAFEPFFTTRPKGAAQGLGLTACHSIIYLHGGQIDIASAPEQGTQVTAWLPMHFLSANATDDANATAEVKAMPAQRKRVLMVDDDPLVRETVKTSLIKVGYEVLTADDGQSAWKMFTRFQRDISLVLTDFRMPVVDGVQLLRQMRELNPSVPVILITGDISGELEKKLAEHNLSVEIVRKPFPLGNLVSRIRQF
ncbi:MAG TPA: response regulator [Verrucomicrobiae bacterium]